MKTNSSRRYRRHRNPEKTDKKEGPFFSPSKAIQTKEDAFFQPKLSVGEPGDKYEKEADKVADQVVNRPVAATGTAVQRKEISAVQAMPEKKEEDKPVQKQAATDKKEEEKPVQKKSAPDKKEEEKPVQKKGDKGKEEEKLQKKSGSDKKEEEKPVQKKESGNEEEEVQMKSQPDKKEEEKPVQKKEEPEKKPAADEVLKEKEEEKKGGAPAVMAKESNSRGAQEGSDQLAQQLKDQRGDGAPLPREVRNEMSNSIGADFGNVRIHTGEKAAALSNELGAQAFTHGNDVYFNNGKYDTDSSAGKHLLAHELTHVVQQGAAPAMEGNRSAAAGHSTPGVQREISTPLPEGVKPDEKSEVANFPIGSFKVEIRPDRKATKEENIAADHAHTSGSIDAVVSYERNKGSNKITKVTISKTLIIQTIYGADATSKGDSGYGRGFIKSDREKGNKSLGFHEGNHGIDFMEYIKTHPFPEIVIKKPVTDAEFATLKAAWDVKHKAYVDDMLATSKKNTDDVTDPPVPATP